MHRPKVDLHIRSHFSTKERYISKVTNTKNRKKIYSLIHYKVFNVSANIGRKILQFTEQLFPQTT